MKRHGFSWLKAILLLAGLGLIAAILFPVFARRRENEHPSSCQFNFKQIGLGIMQYSQDYDERMPRVVTRSSTYGWANALQPYLKSTRLYQCPSENISGQDDPTQSQYIDYWFNAQLSGQLFAKLDFLGTTIMNGDGNDGQDTTDARYSLGMLPDDWLNNTKSPAYRHLDTMNLLFADGHVKAVHAKHIVGSPAQGPSFALKEY